MHALDQTRGFGEVMFGHAQLGDRRRVRRLVSVTNQLCKHPGGSLPDKLKAPKNEPLAKSRTRKSRESRLWLRGTERLPADWRLVDVCDQGADTFEFLEHEVHSGRRFVIRSWHDRQIYPGHQATGSTAALRTHMSSLRAIGGRTIDVAWQSRHGRRKARPARRAKLLISAGAVLVHPPRTKKGEHGDDPLPMWVVRVWEPHPPRNADRVEWFLLTNEPVESLADAMRVIGWYETRWVVEELHKAMKTGCRIEALQFTKMSRLEPMIGVLSTVAVTLLNLRAASRRPDAKTRRATTLISRDYVEILSIWRYGRVRVLSIHEFFFALARLGGHQNRRGDKRPGWLILWRGWATLQAMLDGAEAIRRKTCG